jgi:hypothetical protein
MARNVSGFSSRLQGHRDGRLGYEAEPDRVLPSRMEGHAFLKIAQNLIGGPAPNHHGQLQALGHVKLLAFLDDDANSMPQGHLHSSMPPSPASGIGPGAGRPGRPSGRRSGRPGPRVWVHPGPEAGCGSERWGSRLGGCMNSGVPSPDTRPAGFAADGRGKEQAGGPWAEAEAGTALARCPACCPGAASSAAKS